MRKIGLVEQIMWKYEQKNFTTGYHTSYCYCFVGIYNPEDGHVYAVSKDYYDDDKYEELLSTCAIGDHVEYIGEFKIKKILKNLDHEKRINEFRRAYYQKNDSLSK